MPLLCSCAPGRTVSTAAARRRAGGGFMGRWVPVQLLKLGHERAGCWQLVARAWPGCGGGAGQCQDCWGL